MAARGWRFYVYELYAADGSVAYVGKGSGRRLRAQCLRYFSECPKGGHEVARFMRERDAYAFEIERIAEYRPMLNKCRGGNGNKVRPVVAHKYKWERDIKSAGGTRPYAARLLLRINNVAPRLIDQSKVDAFRWVAFGARP